jgi:hypothetical protein
MAGFGISGVEPLPSATIVLFQNVIKGLRKVTKGFIQGSGHRGQETNPAPIKYNVRVLTT